VVYLDLLSAVFLSPASNVFARLPRRPSYVHLIIEQTQATVSNINWISVPHLPFSGEKKTTKKCGGLYTLTSRSRLAYSSPQALRRRPRLHCRRI
jgi:hypothetical protein